MRFTTDEENARAMNLLENEKNIITGYKYSNTIKHLPCGVCVFDLKDYEDGSVRANYFFNDEVSYLFDKDLRLVSRREVPWGLREWWQYDDQGREIGYLNSNGKMIIHAYHDNGKFRQKTEFEVEFKGYKPTDNRQFVSVTLYNEDGNKTYTKDSNSLETWYDYDNFGREIYAKDSEGKEYWTYYAEENEDRDTYIRKCSDGSEFFRSPLGGYSTTNAAAFFGAK